MGALEFENGYGASASATAKPQRHNGGRAPAPKPKQCSATMTATTLIATRADVEKKARFRALATSRGMDESKLLTLLIDRVLDRNAAPVCFEPAFQANNPSVRVTIRLRAGDGPLLETRARARGMKPATYLGALARAHLRGSAPLPLSELAQLKRAVAELSAIGRNLNQIARAANQHGGISADLAEELRSVRTGLECLRASIADLVKANLISWESDHA